MNLKRFFRSVYVKTQYIKLSLCNINKPKIGDIVYYKGVNCRLIQGVSNPFWNLLILTEENLAKDKRDTYDHVYVNDFKMQPLYKRFNFSFSFTYDFLMTNWYSKDILKTGEISYLIYDKLKTLKTGEQKY